MAKSLLAYSTPAVANVTVGPTVNMSNGNFELCTGPIMIVQANPFCGLQVHTNNTSLAVRHHHHQRCRTS
jgi:hypothetical protein